jgi:hypothetical protein
MTVSLIPSLTKGVLSPQRICDEVLHLCASPKIVELSAEEYVQKQLNSKPDLIKNNTFIDDLYS